MQKAYWHQILNSSFPVQICKRSSLLSFDFDGLDDSLGHTHGESQASATKKICAPGPKCASKLWSCNLCFWSSWGSHRMKSPSGPEPNWSKFIQMECDFSALQHQWFTCIVAVPVLSVASIWFSWRNCTGRKDCGSARVTCVLNVSRHIGIHHINTAYVAGAWLSKHHVFHFPFGRSTFSPSVPTTPRGYRSGTGGSSGLSENFWPTKKPFQLVSIRFICASNLLNRWILIQRFESWFHWRKQQNQLPFAQLQVTPSLLIFEIPPAASHQLSTCFKDRTLAAKRPPCRAMIGKFKVQKREKTYQKTAQNRT